MLPKAEPAGYPWAMPSPSPRATAPIVLCASLAAVGAAFFFQYVMGLQPCPLCHYQRLPYAAAILLSALAVLPPVNERWAAYLVALCGLAFASGTGIAFYHVGVEQGWFEGLAVCAGGGRSDAASVEELMAEIMDTEPVSCSEIPWSLFGVSMAGYNVVCSAGLTALCLAVAAIHVRERSPMASRR